MSDGPSPSPPPSNLPAPRPVDRAALERVLGRAAELQAGSSEPTEALTEEQLIEIGKEVGLSPQHVRQALAEERTRVVLAPEEGLAARLAGPGHATASRTVVGTPTGVLAALDAWMQREECLQVKRRYGERITWEARRDMISGVRRAMNLGGRGYTLARASEVAATVTPVDEGRVLVRLDADVSDTRRQRLAGAGTTAGAGVVTSGSLVAIGVVANAMMAVILPLAILPVAAGIGAAYAVARSHRQIVARTHLALEQVLDRIEHGEVRRPSNVLDLVGDLTRRIP
jgi:hypothetical protein